MGESGGAAVTRVTRIAAQAHRHRLRGSRQEPSTELLVARIRIRIIAGRVPGGDGSSRGRDEDTLIVRLRARRLARLRVRPRPLPAAQVSHVQAQQRQRRTRDHRVAQVELVQAARGAQEGRPALCRRRWPHLHGELLLRPPPDVPLRPLLELVLARAPERQARELRARGAQLGQAACRRR